MLAKFLNTADRELSKLERVMLGIAISAILLTSLIVLIGIGSREILPFRIPDDTTIVEQLMVISIVFGLGYVTKDQSHIAIDLFYTHFNPRFKRLCDGIAVAAGLLVFLPITFWAWHDVSKLFGNGRYYYGELQLLEWPTRGLFFFGFLVLTLRLILILMQKIFSIEEEPTLDTDIAPE